MKLFTIDQNGQLIPYKERVFSEDNFELDLETLLENNPAYFFDNWIYRTILTPYTDIKIALKPDCHSGGC